MQYYNVFVPLLKQIILNANGTQYRLLRGKAMEAVSMIGLAVGRDQFRGDALEIMQLMVQSEGRQASGVFLIRLIPNVWSCVRQCKTCPPMILRFLTCWVLGRVSALC